MEPLNLSQHSTKFDAFRLVEEEMLFCHVASHDHIVLHVPWSLLGKWEILVLSHHFAKFYNYRSCGNEWEPLDLSHHPAKFGGSRPCESITWWIFHVIKQKNKLAHPFYSLKTIFENRIKVRMTNFNTSVVNRRRDNRFWNGKFCFLENHFDLYQSVTFLINNYL